jgi:hypothetical protein
MRQLKRYRTYPCLWVQVDSPGPWYVTALRWALTGFKLDVAVLPVGAELSAVHFLNNLPPVFSHRPSKPSFDCLPFDDTALSKSDWADLRVLRCMARMEHAGIKEIASLASFGVTYTRKIVARLYAKRLIRPFDGASKKEKEKDPTWTINRSGMKYVFKSWNIPHRLHFRRKCVEQKRAGREHRKLTRLFASRLKKAYGCDFDVWQSWSEPDLATENPDTIVWGTYQDVETLVWMEVETGHHSGIEHAKQIEDRYWQAKGVIERHSVRLIFVFLAMPWVLRESARYARFQLTQSTAVIFDHWKDYDHLAKPIFNELNSLSYDNGFKKNKNHRRIPKDPSFFKNFKNR